MYYQRIPAGSDKASVAAEIQRTEPNPEYEKAVKDPYFMEFLQIKPDTHIYGGRDRANVLITSFQHEDEIKMTVRPYTTEDIKAMTDIWNEVVEQGIAFPQEEPLNEQTAEQFFASQSRSAVAVDDSGRIAGLYILHPNNVGRCGHICNASYAVAASCRGMHIGEALVRDCIEAAGQLGFRILQFNAVVETNTAARRLYEKIGFHQLGVIPKGFRMKDGHFENICPYYIEL